MQPVQGELGDPLYALEGVKRDKKRNTLRLFVTEVGLQRGIVAIKKDIAKGRPDGPIDFRVWTVTNPQWEERSERTV